MLKNISKSLVVIAATLVLAICTLPGGYSESWFVGPLFSLICTLYILELLARSRAEKKLKEVETERREKASVIYLNKLIFDDLPIFTSRQDIAKWLRGKGSKKMKFSDWRRTLREAVTRCGWTELTATLSEADQMSTQMREGRKSSLF